MIPAVIYKRNIALFINLPVFNQLGLHELHKTLILMNIFQYVWYNDDELQLEKWGVDNIILDKLESFIRESRTYIEDWEIDIMNKSD